MTGAPRPDGTYGPHILWEAYSSREAATDLAERYSAAVGPGVDTANETCKTWREPADAPERILAICPLSADGPWQPCPAPPEDAASIILISSITRR